MGLPPYATTGQRIWYYAFRVICGLIFFFLIAPILIIIPLSFNAEDFFTFTPAMLSLSAEGYSLKHYQDFFTNNDWQQALWNSVTIAPMATLLSVGFGTLAAIGLSQPHVPFRRAIMAVLISPMIVPLIISAAGMFFFYSRIGLQGTYWGVVLAHAALGIPFVIITVTATLVGFDRSLTRAAANLGADPVTTFFRVQMPLILPGVISGGSLPSSPRLMKLWLFCLWDRPDKRPCHGKCSRACASRSARRSLRLRQSLLQSQLSSLRQLKS